MLYHWQYHPRGELLPELEQLAHYLPLYKLGCLGTELCKVRMENVYFTKYTELTNV